MIYDRAKEIETKEKMGDVLKMRKLMVLLFCAAAILTISGSGSVPAFGAAGSMPFSAVSEGQGIGEPDDLSKLDIKISRAEFMKSVLSSFGTEPDQASVEAGLDLDYVQSALKGNLYQESDFGNTDSSWKQPITRKEAARIAARAVGERTEDDAKWFYLAAKKGLMTGLGQGRLGEQEAVTRSQAVTMVERIRKVRQGVSLPVDKYAVSSAELAWHGTNIFTVMPEVFVASEEQLKGRPVEELWRKDQMVVDPGNGKYKSELEALIAIDLADPHDPNLKLLPPLKEVKWDYFPSSVNGVPTKYIPVKKLPPSYFLMFKGKEIYNKDTRLYSSNSNGPNYGIFGIESPDLKAFYEKGVLNSLGSLFHKKSGDIPGYILPKKGWTQGVHSIKIRVYTPVLTNYGYSSNILLEIDGPHKKVLGD
ncbi:hypothetical protein [Paenibacillus sanfengchensis]|uniref:hypothetical protein n=1 Tax=Paenibacillus sanfengchensis TaxID=3119819 RepID=UPI002FE140DA